jgi:hypothetical protein
MLIPIVILLIISIALEMYNTLYSKQNYNGIGGGSPGMFVRYAIRRGQNCGCGRRPDGRPACDMTGPISYSDDV